jgi:hypothetical protein
MTMLVLDMTHLSQSALKQCVADHCADFGHATVLRVLHPEEPGSCGAAAVEMSDLEEAENLARHFSGSRCGRKVIIRLVQEGHTLPTGLKRHLSPFAPATGISAQLQH